VPWILLVFLSINIIKAEVDYYSPGRIYRFAEYLEEKKEYLRASEEYQRYLFFTSLSQAEKEKILYKIAHCYQRAKKFSRALNYYQQIIKNPKSSLKEAAHYQIALIYFYQGKIQLSLNYLQALQKQTFFSLRMQQLLAGNYLWQKKWQLGLSYLSSLKPDKKTNKLKSLALKGASLPLKKVVWAGVLSGILPGLGKIYAGRWGDGFYSFLIVGVLGWQAWHGFRQAGRNSTRGWIYGTLGTIFYLGNIYGSVMAAKIHNQQKEKLLLLQVKQFFVDKNEN
jgi:tetratricopeptide (TPR) repeat protein